MLTIAVVAPMPSAIVARAVRAKTGDLMSVRAAKPRSLVTELMSTY